jgi:hypothetical protein
MAKKASKPKSTKKSLKVKDLPKAEQGSTKKTKRAKTGAIPPCL